MTRPFRTAVLAALIALCAGVCAEARLDPARVFHPGSGSFLTLSQSTRVISPIEASLFHEDLGEVALLPLPGPDMSVAVPGLPGLSLGLPHIAATFEPRATLAYAAPAIRESVTATTAPEFSAPSEPPVLVSPSVPQTDEPHFGTYAPYTPSLSSGTTVSSVDTRLGHLHFETAFAAMQHCGTADEAAACAQDLSAGTAFDVRAGNRQVNVSLESGVSHMTAPGNVVTAGGVYSYEPMDPDGQAGLAYPGVSDVTGQNVGAQVAVPVSPKLTVGLQYDRTHLEGSTANALLPGFAGMRDTYLGNLTYTFHGSSALTLSARQYRYQDLLTPNLTATQTRADLNFTVKF